MSRLPRVSRVGTQVHRLRWPRPARAREVFDGVALFARISCGAVVLTAPWGWRCGAEVPRLKWWR
ncbi:MAG: hypothetical protein ACK56F_16515 [bacterium]